MQEIEVPGASGRSKEEEDNMFVLGDDDDEVDALGHDAPPAYHAIQESQPIPPADDITQPEPSSLENKAQVVDRTSPSQYHIQPSDTLRGIALRFGIDGAKLCQMNSLPLSTLSTTPHLLHTRRILTLPPGKHIPPPPPIDPKVVEARNRERAEKRFQFVTKEVDWRIAKTYVTLAEGDLDEPKSKEAARASTHSRDVLEEAVDQYLEDEEWELREGQQPRIQGFPLFSPSKGEQGGSKRVISRH